eukprot:467275-Pyramimonas_sp.AAC.1
MLSINPIELITKAVFEGARETLDLSRNSGRQSSGFPKLSEDHLRIKEEHYGIRREYKREEVEKEVYNYPGDVPNPCAKAGRK